MKHITRIFIYIIIFTVSSQPLFAETLGGIKSTVSITSGTPNGPTLASNDFYGSGGGPIGDLDADGVIDFVVGAYGDDTGGNRTGSVHISYLNADGTVKSTVKLTTSTPNGATLVANDFYGFAAGGMGDLDNDGIPDIVIGARQDDTGGTDRGAVYIHYMNRNGTIKSTVKITGSTANGATLANSDNYGYSVFSPGDLDADGIPDLFVGSEADDTGGTNRGAAYIHYMNRDGSIKSTIKLSSATANGPTLPDSSFYGSAVTSIGDLDGDTVVDLGVAAFNDSSGAGAIYLHFMNSNGTVKSTVKIANGTTNGPTLVAGDFYGSAISGLGDLDGDSIPDIGVGAFTDDTGGTDYGAAYIHFMNRDGSIKSTTKLSGSTTNGAVLVPSAAGERYGNTVTSLGDMNGDGATDITVGATLDTYTGGPGSNGQYGRLFIHFMQPVIGDRLSKTSVSVGEGGATDTFQVSLKSKPASSVTVALSSTRQQTTVSPTSLTFTTNNWSTPQTVTVTAIDDTPVEGNHSDSITLTNTSADADYNNLTTGVSVSISDNDSSYNGGGGGGGGGNYVPRSNPAAPTQVGTPAPTVVTPPVSPVFPEVKIFFTKTMKYGSRDPEVFTLQKFLNERGYACGLADGIFGSNTKGCVVRFQTANPPLVADGIVGPLTRAVLNK